MLSTRLQPCLTGIALLLLLSMDCSSLTAQDTLRVMYYNLLNFPSAGATNRQDTMQRIFEHAKPDVLLVCELESASGADAVLSALQSSVSPDFQRAVYVSNQSSSNNLQNMCFFRSSKVQLLGQDEVITDLRDINEYRLEFIKGGLSVPFDTYVAHLKAADGSTNEARRKDAIDDLKNHLASINENRFRLFGGDFNMYRSSETGYQELIAGSDWNFVDPINTPGNWHNSSSFASVHTQSTRSTSFGTGASGGMDDRFDFIMISEEIEADTGAVRYLSGSYEALGQDGNHFNQAINDGANSSAPAGVISALYQSSDHLPVLIDLLIDAPVDTTVGPPVVPTCDLFFSEYIEGSSNNKAFEIYNPTGSAVNLGGYSVNNYNNGNTVPNGTETLGGTLAAGGTFTIVNSSADPALLSIADITSSTTFINGDDAITLTRDGVVIDQIGEVGVDPGSSWPVGSGSTQNHTLIRQPDISQGTANWSVGATQWIVQAEDFFADFGTHNYTGSCSASDSCNTTTAPSGLSATVGVGGVTVSWNDLPGAQKCEVQGRPLGTSTFSKIRVDVPPYEAFVAASRLTPGTTYEWQVRCACSLSPLETTPLSSLASFLWPSPKMGISSIPLHISPSPASEQVTFIIPQPKAGTVILRVFSISGELMFEHHQNTAGQSPAGQETVTVDVTDWAPGLYSANYLSSSGASVGKFVVSP